MYQLNEKDEPVNLFPVGESEIEFKSIAEDEEGGIWAATYGDGVYRFKNDSVYHITSSLGLKNDYCYSIVNGINHSMWTGHRVGYKPYQYREYARDKIRHEHGHNR